jgi:hypothetical protein
VQDALSGSFPFAGADCEAMTQRVLDAFCAGPRHLSGRSGPNLPNTK